MKNLKIAAMLLLAYAVLFALDVTIGDQHRTGAMSWGRFFLFVPTATGLAWGLWRTQRWAWVGTLLFTAVFGVMAVLSLLAGPFLNNSQVALSLDLGVVYVMDALLVAAFILQLLPATRSAVR